MRCIESYGDRGGGECFDLNLKCPPQLMCLNTQFLVGDPVLESYTIKSLKSGILQEEVNCCG